MSTWRGLYTPAAKAQHRPVETLRLLDPHDLEILRFHARRAVVREVVLPPQSLEVEAQGDSLFLIQYGEGAQRRSVPEPELVHDLLRSEGILEDHQAARERDGRQTRAQSRAHRLFAAPQQGRGYALRRRHIPDGRLQHLSDEAGWCPAGHRDAAAGTDDAKQLTRGTLGARGEHRAEHRHDRV